MIPAAEKMIICGSIGSPAARAQAPGKSDRVAGGKGVGKGKKLKIFGKGNIWKIGNIWKGETFGKLEIFEKGKQWIRFLKLLLTLNCKLQLINLLLIPFSNSAV